MAMLHGFILALGLILPLGVQNVFIFNQGATQRNFFLALPAILTAAICDTVLILFAVFGVSLIILTFGWLQIILFSVGFMFLIYMGWSIWKSKPSTSTSNSNQQALSSKKQILFAASVSLLNPHAILDIFGVIGTSSITYQGTEKILFTFSCLLVSWLWFFGLGLAGQWVGQRDPSGKLLLIFNKISALIIWGAGGYIGWQLFSLLLN